MADPASEEEQRKVEAAIEAAIIALEIGIFAIIAERLGSIDGLSYSEIYALMNDDIARIKSTINRGIKHAQNVVKTVMYDMAEANDRWAEKYYRARNRQQVSAFNHSMLGQTLQRYTDNATAKIEAYCRSSVTKIGGNGKEFINIQEAYRRTVSQAATAMTAGEQTLQQSAKKTVERMATDGLVVQYESGATRNLHTAVRTNVMDAYRTAMASMREIQGAEFGADGVEVSAHALCAPDHQPFQGQQYSYKEWRDIQYQPARPLVTGANCGHTVFPVILGISSRAYSDKELKELNDLSNQEVEFEGLSGNNLRMSRYEASQYQRKLETAIRKEREKEYLAEKAGTAYDSAAKHYVKEYKRISKMAGLTARMENTRIYTL